MKKILITGATGFVGRQIMKALSGQMVKLIPVVRVGKEKHIFSSLDIERIISSNDIFLESEGWWEKHCKDIDTIIHCAWYAKPGAYLNSEKNLDCLIGSLKMVKGAVNAGVNHIIGIGTCFEYDLTYSVLSIDTPLKPLTNYAASKTALYFELSNWLAIKKVKFSWCRLFYLYGDGEDEHRLVPYIKKQIESGQPALLTTGNQIRDYMDVREASEKIVSIALQCREGTFNICSGIPITVRQLAEKIADEYSARELLQFGARPDNNIDPPIVIGISNFNCY